MDWSDPHSWAFAFGFFALMAGAVYVAAGLIETGIIALRIPLNRPPRAKRRLVKGAALTASALVMLASVWLFMWWSLPECGLCDDAAYSVSNAPGP
jgi:hypothetical protein